MDTEEKLIALVAEIETKFRAGFIGAHLAERGVKVPVLCEDCDHLRRKDEGGTYCAITWTDVDDDDFCSFGRSREETPDLDDYFFLGEKKDK